MHNLIPTFHFNPDKYGFWEIYETIKRFYPIGILREDGGFYNTYHGLKELQELISDNIVNDKNFKKRWVGFTNQIKTKTSQKIIGTTYGRYPSFSSYIELEKKSFNDVTRLKELHFFVSLLGNFYTIIGQDRNEIKSDKYPFRTTNCLIVSPEGDYEKSFKLLCERIENHFAGYRFVPFNICVQKIIGLDASVSNSSDVDDLIFNALFTGFDLGGQILGNIYYKAGDWIKEGYVDDGHGWTIYPPE